MYGVFVYDLLKENLRVSLRIDYYSLEIRWNGVIRIPIVSVRYIELDTFIFTNILRGGWVFDYLVQFGVSNKSRMQFKLNNVS